MTVRRGGSSDPPPTGRSERIRDSRGSRQVSQTPRPPGSAPSPKYSSSSAQRQPALCPYAIIRSSLSRSVVPRSRYASASAVMLPADNPGRSNRRRPPRAVQTTPRALRCERSTTIKYSVVRRSMSRNSFVARRSGVVRTNSARSEAIRASSADSSRAVSVLFTTDAASPISTSLSVWSFIREMSGEMTSVVPRIRNPGI